MKQPEDGFLRTALGLAGLLVFVAAIQFGINTAGFSEVSGDAFFRALMAYEWRNDPFFISRDFGPFSLFWFPAYFWLTGSLYWLTDDLVFSLKFISLASSMFGLLALYGITRQLADKRAAIIATFLVGITPFHLWLSISMAETSVYLLFVLLAFLCINRWFLRRQFTCLFGAAIFVLCASMLRPEGWVLAVLFSAYVGYLFAFGKTEVSRSLLLITALLPLSFMGVWFTDNWIQHGNPLHFMHLQKDAANLDQRFSMASHWHKALQLPFFILLSSPLLALAVFWAMLSKGRSLSAKIWTYLAFVFVYIAFLALLFMSGMGTTAAPQRYGLVPLVLLTPLAGILLSAGLRGGHVKKIGAVLFLLAYSVVQIVKVYDFPVTYQDATAAGSYLKLSGEASPDTKFRRIATEFELRMLVGTMPYNDRNYAVLSAEHRALAASSERPGDFLTNPLQIYKRGPNPGADRRSLNDLSNSGELQRALEKNLIDTVVVRDRQLMGLLPPAYKLHKTFGRYSILSLHGENASATNVQEAITKQGAYLAPGIKLIRPNYIGSLFPVTLAFQWSLDTPVDTICPYRIHLKATHEVSSADSVISHYRPIFCWYGDTELNAGKVIEERLPLDLPKGFTAGNYNISIALVPVKNGDTTLMPDTHELVSWHELPDVQLVHTKRSAIMGYVSDRKTDFLLLLRVLLSM